MENERCKWCTPDEEGNYTASVWDNDKNGEVKEICIMFYNGEISVGLNDTKIGNLPIKYCPMCGREHKKEEEVDNG